MRLRSTPTPRKSGQRRAACPGDRVDKSRRHSRTDNEVAGMLSRFFIDRPIFAWVIAIFIALAGAISIVQLPVEQYPSIAPPSVVIQTTTRAHQPKPRRTPSRR